MHPLTYYYLAFYHARHAWWYLQDHVGERIHMWIHRLGEAYGKQFDPKPHKRF